MILAVQLTSEGARVLDAYTSHKEVSIKGRRQVTATIKLSRVAILAVSADQTWIPLRELCSRLEAIGIHHKPLEFTTSGIKGGDLTEDLHRLETEGLIKLRRNEDRRRRPVRPTRNI